MDKTLWIMCGAPGVGKTWIAKNYLMKDSSWAYISRDEVRYSIIKEDEEYFQKEDLVFTTFVENIINAFHRAEIKNVIADATHLNWSSRRKLLKALGQETKKTWNIIPVMVIAPTEEMFKNNDERFGRARVPRSVVRRMNAQTTNPGSDPYNYTNILYIDNIRNKGSDSI